MLLLAVPAAGKAQSATPIAPGLTLNHVHLDVVDLDKSIQFYRDLFGATIRDRSPGGNATLSLPGEPTKPTWISLTTTGEANGRYNHVGFGIDFDAAKGDAERLAGEINAKYPESNAQPVGQTISGPNTRSVYVYDPSGIRFQILPKEGWPAADRSRRQQDSQRGTALARATRTGRSLWRERAKGVHPA